MRTQSSVELRRVQVRKFDPPPGELLVEVLVIEGFRSGRCRLRGAVPLDRGAQLVDRSAARQLRVLLIVIPRPPRPLWTATCSSDSRPPPSLAHSGELLPPARHGGVVWRYPVRPDLPGHHAATTAAPVAPRNNSSRIHLGDDPKMRLKSLCATCQSSANPRTSPQYAGHEALPPRPRGCGQGLTSAIGTPVRQISCFGRPVCAGMCRHHLPRGRKEPGLAANAARPSALYRGYLKVSNPDHYAR